LRRFVFILLVILGLSTVTGARAEMPFLLIERESEARVCTEVSGSAKDVFLHYPVIVEGRFNSDKSFLISNVYKGFRNWPIEFSPDGFAGAAIKKDTPALVLAEYTVSGATARCGKVLYAGQETGAPSYAALLAEAAVYGAEVAARLKAEEGGENSERVQHALPRLLRTHDDWLATMEISVKNTREAVAKSQAAQTEMERFRYNRSLEGYEHCAREFQGGLLTTSMRETVLMARGVQAVEQNLPEFAQGLIKMGAYDDVMFVLCGTRSANLYIEAALKADRKGELNGATLAGAGPLHNVDLSGLNLRKIHAIKDWKNVNVAGTDFTNAKFHSVAFENVNLQDARLDMALYDCKTKFPEGFDPVAYHMIPAWSKNGGCDESAIPKVDLSGVSVQPIPAVNPSSKSGQIDLGYFIVLDGVVARQARLGEVVCSTCKIKNADFTGVKMSFRQGDRATQFTDTTFKNADLRGSNINTATLTNVDFSGADLSGVNLGNATLLNVNFEGAILEETRFEGAKYDAATKFPDGFDPVAANAKRIIQ